MKRISPTHVTIDLDALRYNFRQLRQKLPRGVRPLSVVKSNAYGHGAVKVARALEEEGTAWFGVGTMDEGVELRKSGIRSPILILLGVLPGTCEESCRILVRQKLTPVLYDLDQVKALSDGLAQRKATLGYHIKVDTGMTRLGVFPEDLESFLKKALRCTSLKPEGLLTHLADAGNAAYTAAQAARFEQARSVFSRFVPNGLCHLANSQAVMDGIFGRPDRLMARFGIALYGAYPLEKDRKRIRLKPVLGWKTRIAGLKTIAPGTPVSYGRKFRARKATKVGILPVGYADGYPRNLSNRYHVLVKGRKARIAGTICMDMMMVDLTGVPGARVGDEVVLLGRQGRQEIRAEDMAAKSGTISYEIFCRISPRLRRESRGSGGER